jgi:hypothetical protein
VQITLAGVFFTYIPKNDDIFKQNRDNFIAEKQPQAGFFIIQKNPACLIIQYQQHFVKCFIDFNQCFLTKFNSF